jgi:AmiR/NasT family two-component response regulator
MDASDEELQRLVTDALAEICARRTVVDEVKGMLMLIYRIDDQGAFDLLRSRSQATNMKVRLLAPQILEDFASLSYGDALPSRSMFNALLFTAHERCQLAA